MPDRMQEFSLNKLQERLIFYKLAFVVLEI